MIGKVRRMQFRHHLSFSDIARRTGLSRKHSEEVGEGLGGARVRNIGVSRALDEIGPELGDVRERRRHSWFRYASLRSTDDQKQNQNRDSAVQLHVKSRSAETD